MLTEDIADIRIDPLPKVTAPTLLLVGSLDGHVIGMNERALDALGGEKQLIILKRQGTCSRSRARLNRSYGMRRSGSFPTSTALHTEGEP